MAFPYFQRLHPPLAAYVRSLTQLPLTVPAERRRQLDRLAKYLSTQPEPALHFVCTHNSRRSQVAQAWALVGAEVYLKSELQIFSGGTEVTAFHPNAVAALRDIGFNIEQKTEGPNPRYAVNANATGSTEIMWSKTFDDPVNPHAGFAAVKTCTEADAACPILPGAKLNLLLPFEDPKTSDGTPEAPVAYERTVRQIGRELLYVFEKAFT